MNQPPALEAGALEPPISEEAWPLETAFSEPVFILLHDAEIAYLMNEGILPSESRYRETT